MCKYSIIGIFVLVGCGGSEFTSIDSQLDLDAGTEARVDTGVDSNVEAQVDTGIDAQVDTGIDAQVDTGIDAQVDTGIDAQIDTGIQCGPGCEIVNNACYCPEPQCCSAVSDCPDLSYYCKSGSCTTNQNANCDLAGCNLYCVHCYNPTYAGSCNGNKCECNQI